MTTYVTALDVDPGDVINLPFDYIEDAASVNVFADGTLVDPSRYTWSGPLQITAGPTFPANTRVIVIRSTDPSEWGLQSTTGYYDARTGNATINRAFNILQELKDAEALALKLRPSDTVREGYVPVMGSDGRMIEGPSAAAIGLANEISLAAMNTALAGATAVSGGNLSYLLGMYGDEVKKLPVRVLYASMFGTNGTGAVSDTTALNSMMTYIRSLVGTSRVPVRVYLDGVFLVDGDGVNACGLRAWNLEFVGGAFIGETAGKPIWTMVGSRGYKFTGTLFYGEQSAMPSVPILIARGTASSDGYCDNAAFDGVTTYGWFSEWAHYAYAQETTSHTHCRYWNYNPDARVACFEGLDEHPQVSPYSTILTGAASFINCEYINCDFRYLPSGNQFTITAITKGNNPTVTFSGAAPADGDELIFWLVTGMTEINALKCTVSGLSGNTFTASGINSTGFGTFTGGYAIKCMSASALFMGRMEQHRFRGCYVVAYGDYAIEYKFQSDQTLQQSTFDFLYEGAQATAMVLIDVGSTAQTMRETFWMAYNTHCRGSFFKITGAGSLTVFGGGVSCTRNIYANILLTDGANDGKFAFNSGSRILWPTRAGVNVSGYSAFKGEVGCVDDGEVVLYGHKYREKEDGTWTPTVAATSGTITTVGAVSANVRYLGDWVWVDASITITTNGTGATSITVTLPVAAASGGRAYLVGRETGVGGQMLQGRIGSGSTVVTIFTDDNTYPGADGAVIEFSGWYRRA